MWDRLIGLCSNLVFVFSGHVLNNGTGCLISEDVHGNRVCQMMANYQAGTVGSVNGGNGFLRILDIDAKNGRVVELFALYGYFPDGAGSSIRHRRA